MPHIGIDDSGEVGAISRPGRPKVSHACGALLKALGEVKSEGIGRNFAIPGATLRWELQHISAAAEAAACSGWGSGGGSKGGVCSHTRVDG